MKSTATATIWFEDGTEITHTNVTYSKWDSKHRFIVQRYHPDNESRLQTFIYKRKNIKSTMREQDYNAELDLTEKPSPAEGLDDLKPQSIYIREGLTNRWIITYGPRQDLAWTGQRWMPHIGGQTIGLGKTPISNFASRKQAEAHAKERFPNAALE
jgi:hypothetical protein